MFATKIPTLNELIRKIWIIPADFAFRDFYFFLREDKLEGLGLSQDTNFEDIVRWNDGNHMKVQREYTEFNIEKKVEIIKDFAQIVNGDASGQKIYVNEFNICPLCTKSLIEKAENLFAKNGPRESLKVQRYLDEIVQKRGVMSIDWADQVNTANIFMRNF